MIDLLITVAVVIVLFGVSLAVSAVKFYNTFTEGDNE